MCALVLTWNLNNKQSNQTIVDMWSMHVSNYKTSPYLLLYKTFKPIIHYGTLCAPTYVLLLNKYDHSK